MEPVRRLGHQEEIIGMEYSLPEASSHQIDLNSGWTSGEKSSSMSMFFFYIFLCFFYYFYFDFFYFKNFMVNWSESKLVSNRPNLFIIGPMIF